MKRKTLNYPPLAADLNAVRENALALTAKRSPLNKYFFDKAIEQLDWWVDNGPALERMADDGWRPVYSEMKIYHDGYRGSY